MWLLSLFQLLPRVFNTVDNITNKISDERIKLIEAKTDAQRISAEEKVATLQARRDVLVAESSKSVINSVVRACISASAAIILAKLLVWDKVVGSLVGCAGEAGQALACATFRTDPIDAYQWGAISAVVGFYFLYEGFTNRK